MNVVYLDPCSHHIVFILGLTKFAWKIFLFKEWFTYISVSNYFSCECNLLLINCFDFCYKELLGLIYYIQYILLPESRLISSTVSSSTKFMSHMKFPFVSEGIAKSTFKHKVSLIGLRRKRKPKKNALLSMIFFHLTSHDTFR